MEFITDMPCIAFDPWMEDDCDEQTRLKRVTFEMENASCGKKNVKRKYCLVMPIMSYGFSKSKFGRLKNTSMKLPIGACGN